MKINQSNENIKKITVSYEHNSSRLDHIFNMVIHFHPRVLCFIYSSLLNNYKGEFRVHTLQDEPSNTGGSY